MKKLIEFIMLILQCEGIVEEQEDDLFELFSKPTTGIVKELCYKRNKICPKSKIKRDEL